MAYPEAVKKPDHRGMLPLHYACASGAPEQHIAMLLMIYQQGARTMDTVENSLPIHQLCQRRTLYEEAFCLLLIANPESIDAKDINGKTPLDIITAKHAMARVVGVLQETEAKLLEALSNVAKLQAEVGVLEQGTRSLEERLNEISAAEQMWKRELFCLTNLLKIYSDCNSILKSKVKMRWQCLLRDFLGRKGQARSQKHRLGANLCFTQSRKPSKGVHQT
jgi:hypothetical protein